ncbi:transcriptional regulator with XRE-family HTH domain [Rhizobium leguminosarum]|uniref:Transcriptional regulator with XRE-family HTH domain n=1 Tax=Rhizobium leguminosarum TaxID=384 RepID=A0A7Z0IWS0_RHILE|nr:helix-turn-helix transcriptional regulator [Rhizobium leguminosarum]NYJ09784.1 transcriptional regulator with XRE-family HTH domain [Rhizobium leguminosarum]
MTDSTDEESYLAALQIFGSMIMRQRHASQWSLYRLAEKSGVDETVISQLEAGEDAGTEVEREKLCDFLGIDLDTFPRVLRTYRTSLKALSAIEDQTGEMSNVVQLQGYRAKWQKITTHPED